MKDWISGCLNPLPLAYMVMMVNVATNSKFVTTVPVRPGNTGVIVVSLWQAPINCVVLREYVWTVSWQYSTVKCPKGRVLCASNQNPGDDHEVQANITSAPICHRYPSKACMQRKCIEFHFTLNEYHSFIERAIGEYLKFYRVLGALYGITLVAKSESQDFNTWLTLKNNKNVNVR